MRCQLKVFRPEQGVSFLECEAAGLEEARLEHVELGWVVLSVKPLSETRFTWKRRVRFPLLLFSQELLALLSAGLNLVESIDALRDKEAEGPVRRILADMGDGLRSGLSLSRALQRHEDTFPTLFRAAIEASEQTGEVADALKRFIVYERQFQALRSRLSGALIYPAVLATLGAAVTLFLLGYVVPRFSVVFADRMDELPALSGAVIRFGLLLSEHPMEAGAIALLALAGLSFAVSRKSVWAWLAIKAWQMPGIGMQLRHYQLARMYRSLGMLMRGGIPAVRAMEMVAVLMSASARQGMQHAIAAVREGQPISVALRAQGLTTSVADRLLAVGERSGRMGDLLEHTADFLDEELSRRMDRVIRLVEPLMMIIIGFIVGGIVMLMYLPIFELADSVK